MKRFWKISYSYFILTERQCYIYKNKWAVISRLYRRKAPILSFETEAESFFSDAKYVVDGKSYSITGHNLRVMVIQNLYQKHAYKVQCKLIPNYTFKMAVVIHEEGWSKV